ncbi:hypothetical protein SAMN05892883_3100 [Jatrophihabitans sp. GAS493]|uniref:hypothetical protein n=1 Tax=Jatrophihabitans sp. GAS493 TaxID=1907575 RepID=UPI000BB69C1B|nr:hypothetical protein [Jatrophihabitans sp. GAS493]SOD73907.1 hypothetical protein SAMN05892883_3100 [Jatrophihabitans sp. GAS493]
MRVRRRSADESGESLGAFEPEIEVAVVEVRRRRVRRVPLRHAALGIGLGRTALGTTFLLHPVYSTRVIGLDIGTATRVTWLARMAAVRDVSIGVGTLATALGHRGRGPWLLAGAVSDLVDGAVIATAAQQRRLDPVRGTVGAGLAVGAAAVGFVAVWDSFRRRS